MGVAFSSERGDKPLGEFAQNVVTHVLLHELGHAVFREFKLPYLGNEEGMADAFANNYITQFMRDDAVHSYKPCTILDD